MTEVLVAGLLAGYGIAVPVGAIAALIMSLSARTSFRVGAAAALGVAAADGLFALVAVLGGAALAGVVHPIAVPLRWLAVTVLIGLAVRTAVVALRHHRAPPDQVGTWTTTPARAFFGFLGLTLLNPLTIVYFGALVLGRQGAAGLGALGDMVFVLAAFAASASWQLVLAGGGSVLGRLLTGRRGRLVTALVSSAVIAGLAVDLLLSG
ncbi:LysE/ArgO family amino acid transporter [Allokutzneria albata]|uniref:Arginine exporter protein ArgO n=1 Tax=Allokutzneria albata TaxID=211114 RepID=A0A1H0A4B2_ALLAB|nr:LysE family transporter [Allokutzneria albata]SDN27803.1 Arginine exporter protein ArgO [Allokutzneria albata]